MVNRTRIQVAVGLSLLTHAMLAAIPLSQRQGIDIGPVHDVPLTIHLIEPRSPVAKVLPQPQPVVKPEPHTKPRAATAERIVAAPQARPEPAPTPVETPAPTAERQPQFDMLAMINARRERRREVEQAMIDQMHARAASGAETRTDAEGDAIARNLETLHAGGEGVGGVFTILHKGTRTAEFAFNGWRPDTHRQWREVIEVDAGPGGDVELAIVRRMIALIRTHYAGDFVWRSHRLGKEIVLSARVEDNAQLEDFLTREFFGTPTLGQHNLSKK